jgi:hypothetical protein
MSIAGIASSSNVFQSTVAQQTQNRFQQIQSQFQKLGQDLQSGNLTAAQQDFATIQQSATQAQASGQTHHGHHHHHSSGDSNTTSTISSLQQDFTSLGQDLQSGNLSSAQQVYASLQSELQQFLPSFAASSTTGAIASVPSATTGVSVVA